MKKVLILYIVLSAALPAFAQQDGYDPFPLLGWTFYKSAGSNLNAQTDGLGIIVSGAGSGGSVVQVQTGDLGLGGKTRLKVTVSGIVDAGGNADVFNRSRLFKLEINGTPLATVTPGMINLVDRTYVNALNYEFEFDISAIRSIRKMELVFFDMKVSALKIGMSVR
jgi:hypothetical protein